MRQFVGLLGVLSPFDRDSVGLDERVVLAPITLNGHGHKGGIDDLATLKFDP